jgi:hypothetical protein
MLIIVMSSVILLSIVMLSVILLSIILLSVVMLSVVVEIVLAPPKLVLFVFLSKFCDPNLVLASNQGSNQLEGEQSLLTCDQFSKNFTTVNYSRRLIKLLV